MEFEPQSEKKSRPEYKPFVPGPNPELQDFITQHATPYDPANDRYDVPAFDRDLIVDKAFPPKAIYDMHTYWSKKHWAAIREYIRHYLPEEYYPSGAGLVMDCFAGSGMTGVAAMTQDRPCILIDASPAAAFISHCYTHPVDAHELRAVYDLMMTEDYPKDLRSKLKAITGENISNLQQELAWLYETKCDRCGGEATTEYVVYSEQFQCPGCARIVALYDCPDVVEDRKNRYCPHCLALHQGAASEDYLISTRSRRFGAVPVLVSYKCRGSCKPARDKRTHKDSQRMRKGRYFLEFDLAKIKVIERAQIPHSYPKRKMMDIEDDSKPWGVKWRAGTSSFRSVAELYTRRNLWALSACFASAKSDALNMMLSTASLPLSRMCRDKWPSVAAGTYYIPQLNREMSASQNLHQRLRQKTEAYEGLTLLIGGRKAPVISNEASASCIRRFPRQGTPVVDYIFTDPAYVDKTQYGELNFVWESWLGFPSDWLKDEIVVNLFRNKTVEDWDQKLREVLGLCFQVLKPGRWLSLCYHDTDPGTWRRVQDMLLDIGFEIHTVTVLDPKQKSSNQLKGEKVVKSDLVLNCRKPRMGDVKVAAEAAEVELVSKRVREVILETLSSTAGQTRERLWDTVLKRLLSRGQMAEHRYEDILGEVAFRSEAGRWFLKEEYESLSQNDIRNEEEAGDAIERFARLRCTGVPVQLAAHIALALPHLAGPQAEEGEIEKTIKENLINDVDLARKFKLSGRMKGIEFYDCLFFYLTRFLKGRPAGKIPRRNLAEFLEEYLVRFKDGDKWLYRPPDKAEAESLKRSRQSGLGRRIRQFVSFLRGEGELPKEKLPDAKTQVAWLKHCAAFGLADEGVLLFEKGGLAGQLYSLSQDDRYDAEEYYQSCKRKASHPREEDEEDLEVDEAEGGEEE